MHSLEHLEAEVRRLTAECRRLRQENATLRQALSQQAQKPQHAASSSPAPAVPHTQMTRPSASIVSDRIALFRSLFRGRDDVFARRWEARNGRTGYSPACKNEWDPHLCRKPCSGCKNASYVPLTDEIVAKHLSDPTGKHTIGVYPLLTNETCWFLAVDFDGGSWREDAVAFLDAAHTLEVPAYLERSRSGNGGHAWIFFDTPLSAQTARDMGASIITSAMENRPEIGFSSYDRFFPNQSTMPKGGFGNLIALPLQRGPASLGNSMFVDSSMRPFRDQWQFLAQIRRMSTQSAMELVRRALARGAVTGVCSTPDDDSDAPSLSISPWALQPSHRADERIPGPFPPSVRVVRANMVYIEKDGLPPRMLVRLRRLAAFQNPEFHRAQQMRLSTFGLPRVICCADDHPRYVVLPRGCFDRAIDLLDEHGITPVIQDERLNGTPLDACFHGELTFGQQKAADALLCQDDGVLSAPTAFGKTVLASWLIAQRRTNTLVLVHRRQLMDQWRLQLSSFLNLTIEQIGQLGGGKWSPTGLVDVGMLQSLNRSGKVDDVVATYGHIIVDECHHVSAVSFEQVLKHARAKYVLGLTATPIRKDGRHPIVMMQSGPLRTRLNATSATANRFQHIVIRRLTPFSVVEADAPTPIHKLYAMLANDADRNAMILSDIIQASKAGRSPLVLTERTAHLETLAGSLAQQVKHVIVLRGGYSDKQRRQLAQRLAEIPIDEERVIVATGRYIGEGFDDARLDTLFLTLPISWKGTLQQYAGRLHRAHEGKHVVQIYDYVDNQVPTLSRMYARRLNGYKAMGYSITDDGIDNRMGDEREQTLF